VRNSLLDGWRPERDLQPVRLMTLVLLGVGSFVLAILCFRVLGTLSGGAHMLLWAGLCFSPPLAVGLWILDEKRRRSTGEGSMPEQPLPAELEQAPAVAAPAEARLTINREVA
jgi:hypothetical protein